MSILRDIKSLLKQEWKRYAIILLSIVLLYIVIQLSICSGKVQQSMSTEKWTYIPILEKEDVDVFKKYLEKGNRCFEFGSGYGTIYIAKLNNIDKVKSIENDIEWYEKIESKIQEEKLGDFVDLVYVNTNSDHTSWGYPRTSDLGKFRNYYTAYDPSFKADIIYIDGRFRVSCGLDLINKIDTTTYVMVDDFTNRPWYQDLLKYYDKEECGKLLVVLKKKHLINRDELNNDIEKYKFDSR